MPKTSRLLYTPDIPPSEFHGLWAAKIENNVDPLGIGRLQIRVPQIHGPDVDDVAQYEARTGIVFREEQTDIPFGSQPTPNIAMPWAFPCLPYGSFNIPPIGEWVWIMFMQQDPDYPIWMGTWYQIDGPQEAGTDVFSRGSLPDPLADPSVKEIPIPGIPQFFLGRKQWKRVLPANSNATTDPLVDAGRIAHADANPDVSPIIRQNGQVQYSYDTLTPVFTVPGGQEKFAPINVPPDAADYPVVEPSIHVIYRTPMGAELTVGEREQNQYVKLVDATGAILEFSSPYKRALNLDYALRRIKEDISKKVGDGTALYTLFAKLVNLTSFAQIVAQLGQQLNLSTDATNATATLAGLNQSLVMTCNHLLQDNPQGNLTWQPGDQTGTIELKGVGGMRIFMKTTGPAIAPVQNGSTQDTSTTHIEISDGKKTTHTIDSIAPQGGTQGNTSTAIKTTTFHGETIALVSNDTGTSATSAFQVKLLDGATINAAYDGVTGTYSSTTKGIDGSTLISQTGGGPIVLQTPNTTVIIS